MNEKKNFFMDGSKVETYMFYIEKKK